MGEQYEYTETKLTAWRTAVSAPHDNTLFIPTFRQATLVQPYQRKFPLVISEDRSVLPLRPPCSLHTTAASATDDALLCHPTHTSRLRPGAAAHPTGCAPHQNQRHPLNDPLHAFSWYAAHRSPCCHPAH